MCGRVRNTGQKAAETSAVVLPDQLGSQGWVFRRFQFRLSLH
uniref:Uncharacterized protein n=1 Tax=Romanomermis culicivorax TaxID=13658 RepID=A0A915KUB8_ROMCU